MRFAGTRIAGGMVLFASCVGAAPLAAQARFADVTWTLEGSHDGYCIWYLAEPEVARKLIPGSAVLTPAGTGAGLPSLLASTIKEEPRFADWIPGSICFGFYQRVMADGHVLAAGKGGRPIIIATNAIAVKDARGIPGATEYLLDFMTDNRNLSSAADRFGVDMSGVEYLTRLRVEGGDPAQTITVAGVVISWSGHPLADSSVGKTRSVSFGYGGPKTGNWLVRLESAPATNRQIVGNLSIDGRNTLAKALLASPVRAIGPQDAGGTTTITFHVVTK